MPKRKEKRKRQAAASKRKKRPKKSSLSVELDEPPKVGMRVDARDVDYIWSCGTVSKVSQKHKVTVSFDGWDESFNETFQWSSSKKNERLAPIYSFSKCVKCLVTLLPKRRGPPTLEQKQELPEGAPHVLSNHWPCKVFFRMPHPIDVNAPEEDLEFCNNAQAFLQDQPNVFIVPYAPHLLSEKVQSSLQKFRCGIWIHVSSAKPWTNNPSLELGFLPEHFEEAFDIAQADDETPGVLPADAIDQGSLLKEEYQVHSRSGAQVRDGALYKEQVDNGVEEEAEEQEVHVEEEEDEEEEIKVEEEEEGEEVKVEEDEIDIVMHPPADENVETTLEEATEQAPTAGSREESSRCIIS